MEFWGVEVKSGQPLKVQPQYGKIIHISQAALGEVKDVKEAKHVPLRLKIGNKSFILGSLSSEDRTQLMFDLVFEKEFELSHDWKKGSVYFVGYIADDPASDGEDFSDEFDDESEDELLEAPENGKVKPKIGEMKAAKNAISTTKPAKKKVEDSDSDEEEDDSESESALDGSSSEEELPKAALTKKRPAESARETPNPAKKAKSATPEKTGNKNGHVATPFPSKSSGKASPGKKSHSKAKQGGR